MENVIVSPQAVDRLSAAERWLLSRGSATPLLVIAPTRESGAELLRRAALASPRGASFGWQRMTLGRLAAVLAGPTLADRGFTPIGLLAVEAVTTRVVHDLMTAGHVDRYAKVVHSPGFTRALGGTLSELRLARVARAAVERSAPELLPYLDAFESALARAGLADRALVLACAEEAARARSQDHSLLALPTLLFDLQVASAAEAAFVGAILTRAQEWCAIVPAGEERTLACLRALTGSKEDAVEAKSQAAPASSLQRLQHFLFGTEIPDKQPLDDEVTVFSAPGESRECVEIARRMVRFARDGIPFDRIAVLVRSLEQYRPHLEEAFARARVPVYFARGARRPDPTGRALLALLACAADGLPASRFAEYLSLGQVPDPTADGYPPPAPPAPERWVPTEEEFLSETIIDAAPPGLPTEDMRISVDPDASPVARGTLRAPWRWERLLVDAAVIGGRERWVRRLAGIEQELRLVLAEHADEEDPGAIKLRRDLADLASLRDYALPLLDSLAALPREAPWGVWLEQLSALSARALRNPERAQAVLAELAPMAKVGPVTLDEVRFVLSRRLLEVEKPAPRSREGRLFIAAAEAARGMVFDVVAVPGLAEHLFPRKISEEPLLLDALRAKLDPALTTHADRISNERQALRIAVGAARRKVVLSYPRLDLEQSRPRVPSFYALEALRASEGVLPGFDDLALRAEAVTDSRVGWPAPALPEDAIDEAEHDLALLSRLLDLPAEESLGTAQYLLSSNSHLGRALRFRARRSHRAWTVADGLVAQRGVPLAQGALEALAAQRLDSRSFSPSSLQHFAACPYRFFLHAVHRLAPRKTPEAIEQMDPLQRGALVHEVQFQLLRSLADAALLPVQAASLERAFGELDVVLEVVTKRYHDDLAPAIERVWEDGIDVIRADLREWLRHMADDASGFIPWRFELAFGLSGAKAHGRHPDSVADAMVLDCGLQLRGSIDLVERRAGDTGEELRITDHKTGKVRFEEGGVIGGGEVLQPVLYALAAEKIFPESKVVAGRLHYCSAEAGFGERAVQLNDDARAAADSVARAIDAAISSPFIPAFPINRACDYCDYRVVCGPYEEIRTRRKDRKRPELGPLIALRGHA